MPSPTMAAVPLVACANMDSVSGSHCPSGSDAITAHPVVLVVALLQSSTVSSSITLEEGQRETALERISA